VQAFKPPSQKATGADAAALFPSYHLPIVSLIAIMDAFAGGSPHHGIGEFGLVCAVLAATSCRGNRIKDELSTDAEPQKIHSSNTRIYRFYDFR